jgi:hypothetical protein
VVRRLQEEISIAIILVELNMKEKSISKDGEESGTIADDNIATAVKCYLREKYDNSCQKCGWHEINPYTGLVPL